MRGGNKNKKSIYFTIFTVTVLLSSFMIILIQFIPIIGSAPPQTHTVDDDGPADFSTIQEAVDAAQNGDTVFVFSGYYDEDVIIEKTINLTGEDRETTFINGSGGGGSIWARYADYINVSEFTLQNGGTGISIYYSNFSKVENCKAIFNQYGIIVSNSNGTIVENNIASNNSNYHGIYLYQSTNISIENNVCFNNSLGAGIWLQESLDIIIKNNLFYANKHGIYLTTFNYNHQIINNIIKTSSQYGIRIVNSDLNILENNTLESNLRALSESASIGNLMVNSSIIDSIEYDITVGTNSHLTILNTSFTKSKTYFFDLSSTINVKWYLHIGVTNYLGDPVPNANVNIEDNLNGSYNEVFVSDLEGRVKWVPITEYIEQDFTGDTIGEKKYFTPHRIIAWNNTLVGYAYPEPFMNKSNTINIILYNGTLVEMENNNWNMISIPRIQSDTNLDVVLQSIEGRYKSVQWYDTSDINDLWKHYSISKPSYMNDLQKINHTMGLWIDIIDPQGTTLVIFGEQLTSNQTIPLSLGWNFLGFPSGSNKLVNDSLNGIFYGNDVDAIWTFNSTTQEWIELGPLDYFEVGHGYWIHSKVEEIWNIPV